MTFRRGVSALVMAAMLSSCGGGGDGGSLTVVPGGGGNGTGGATPTPSTPTPTACTLRDRQNWVRGRLDEWYLFPETLPTALDPSGFPTVQDYLDALTATARAQRRDRFFTYITSIAEENAFINSGASAGFGVRLSFEQAGRLFIAEAFENAPAFQGGIDRGDEVLAIGDSVASLVPVATLLARDGQNAIHAALGPATPGLARTLRVGQPGQASRTVTITKADYALAPVSPRYGARVIEDGGRRVGYINLRTFGTSTAEQPLRDAFLSFRQQGITNLIIDVRYNGGGLVRIAELVGDLMGANRTTGDVLSYTVFRPSKSGENEQRNFRPQPESIAPARVAFITTGASASASEFIVNNAVPYLGANAALIGTNSFGKPVGQIAQDRAACDDRLRVVAFATQNSQRRNDYFDGLIRTVQASCQAADDIGFPLGDAREASVARALDFIAGRPCAPIGAGAVQQQRSRSLEMRELLQPDRPTAAQREVPGMF